MVFAFLNIANQGKLFEISKSNKMCIHNTLPATFQCRLQNPSSILFPSAEWAKQLHAVFFLKIFNQQ